MEQNRRLSAKSFHPSKKAPRRPRALRNGGVEYARILIFLALLLIVFSLGFIAARQEGGQPQKAAPAYSNISEGELNLWLAGNDFFLLDVHVPEAAEHLNGTDAFIPYDAIGKNPATLPKDKGAKIVVYCRSGRMSAIASQKLAELGYTSIYNVQGGVAEYRNDAKKAAANNSSAAASQAQALQNATANSTVAQALPPPQNKSRDLLLFEEINPPQGIRLAGKWLDLGRKVARSGALNTASAMAALQRNGYPVTKVQSGILENHSNETILVDRNNSLFMLYLFWAFGLANKNSILENGTMSSNQSFIPYYASTGGWTLGAKSGGELFAGSSLISLDERQQAMVEEVAGSTYRPCCDNPTMHPDCNHGMAALGLAEWLAYQNASKDEIYQAILAVNSYWFPQNYLDLNAYFSEQNKSWESMGAKEILSKKYSSASGYSGTRKKINDLPKPVVIPGGCGA